MALSANLFQAALGQFALGNAQWHTGGAHTIKAVLLTSTAAPDIATWTHFSDVTNEVVGPGYVAGGTTLTVSDPVATAAGSWGDIWTVSQTWTTGQIIRPASLTPPNYLFECVVGGDGSGSTEPTWTGLIPGETIADGAAIWSCLGESITTYSSASAVWAASTITARYFVIYDATTGVAATEPLICLYNLDVDRSTTSGTFTVAPDPLLGWFWTSLA